MKTVLLLGGPAAGQRVEVHGAMTSYHVFGTLGEHTYRVVPMCSHGEVHWFGVLDGADPLALLIEGYAPAGSAEALLREVYHGEDSLPKDARYAIEAFFGGKP